MGTAFLKNFQKCIDAVSMKVYNIVTDTVSTKKPKGDSG